MFDREKARIGATARFTGPGPTKPPTPDNPYETCITCGKKARSRAMIYDVPGDVFMHWSCEDRRPDRWL